MHWNFNNTHLSINTVKQIVKPLKIFRIFLFVKKKFMAHENWTFDFDVWNKIFPLNKIPLFTNFTKDLIWMNVLRVHLFDNSYRCEKPDVSFPFQRTYFRACFSFYTNRCNLSENSECWKFLHLIKCHFHT